MDYQAIYEATHKVTARLDDLTNSLEGDLGVIADSIGELTTFLAGIFQPQSWREIYVSHETLDYEGQIYSLLVQALYSHEQEVCKVIWRYGVFRFDEWDKTETEVFIEPLYSKAIRKIVTSTSENLSAYAIATAPLVAEFLKEEN